MKYINELREGENNSISAFCNAGFDLFGNYNSIVAYADDERTTFTFLDASSLKKYSAIAAGSATGSSI